MPIVYICVAVSFKRGGEGKLMFSFVGYLATHVVELLKNFKACSGLCQYWEDLNSKIDLL